MARNATLDFAEFYSGFQAPIAAFDCGQRCAPHNESGAPFCCDKRHAIPTAYLGEWDYLERHSDLWRLWQGQQPRETARLRAQAPEGQVLIACKGYAYCQRDFRSLTCRAFPFFPYLTRQGEFIGLAYYWEYEDRCWVISNLWIVTPEYRRQFVAAYDQLFERTPGEREDFRHYSAVMRRVFGRRRRALPLLHRNGHAYKITPRSGRMRRVSLESLPVFGPYRVAAEMPFPDELERLR